MNITTSPPISPAVQRLRDHLLAGGLPALLEAVTDGVVLHVPGRQPLSGAHAGRAAVLRFIEDSRARTDHGERIEIVDVLAGAEHVGVYCHVTAERGDRRLDNVTVHVLHVVDGRVDEIWLHNFDDHTVTEFWS